MADFSSINETIRQMKWMAMQDWLSRRRSDRSMDYLGEQDRLMRGRTEHADALAQLGNSMMENLQRKGNKALAAGDMMGYQSALQEQQNLGETMTAISQSLGMGKETEGAGALFPGLGQKDAMARLDDFALSNRAKEQRVIDVESNRLKDEANKIAKDRQARLLAGGGEGGGNEQLILLLKREKYIEHLLSLGATGEDAKMLADKRFGKI